MAARGLGKAGRHRISRQEWSEAVVYVTESFYDSRRTGRTWAPWRHDLRAIPGTNTEGGRQEATPHFIFGTGTKARNRSLTDLFFNH